MDKIKTYFKDYPHKEKVFETSDGLMFHEKGDAHLHAQGLKDKEVKEHLAAKQNIGEDAEKEIEGADTEEAKPAGKKKGK
ncbi:MAG: hypothetical protein JST21_04690 [Bacteroidetes bacterium]|nr:hypothetical protein [Bacteroidota bacterium]